MEVVDELMTPGCPQCAIKHLSAAVAYMVGPYPGGAPVLTSCVWAAVARINLVEVMAGYRSHLWYAVGMLVRSEEAARYEGSACAAAREARLVLEERGLDGVEHARAVGSGITVENAVDVQYNAVEFAIVRQVENVVFPAVVLRREFRVTVSAYDVQAGGLSHVPDGTVEARGSLIGKPPHAVVQYEQYLLHATAPDVCVDGCIISHNYTLGNEKMPSRCETANPIF